MADMETGPPAKPKTRSLPIHFWPEADRKAWTAAFRPATRLKHGGVAGHLKPVTRDDHARQYGNFVGFLDRAGLLRLEGLAAVNVTADNVNAYLTEIKGAWAQFRSTAQFASFGVPHNILRQTAISPGSPRSARIWHLWRGLARNLAA